MSLEVGLDFSFTYHPGSLTILGLCSHPEVVILTSLDCCEDWVRQVGRALAVQ